MCIFIYGWMCVFLHGAAHVRTGPSERLAVCRGREPRVRLPRGGAAGLKRKREKEHAGESERESESEHESESGG